MIKKLFTFIKSKSLNQFTKKLIDNCSIKGKCQCELCIEARTFDKYMQTMPTQQQKFFKEFYDKYQHIAMDENYHRAILDGSWPDAVQILEWALEKAKNQKADEEKLVDLKISGSIHFSKEDALLFLDVTNKPNDALKEAFSKYRKVRDEN